MNLNEQILQNLLNEREMAIAKKSISERNGEEVPKHFVDRLSAVENSIKKVKVAMIEEAIKNAKNNA